MTGSSTGAAGEAPKGVTPPMQAWWFGRLDGDVGLEGRRVPRHRVWRPFDRIYATYVRRTAVGSIGPGAQIANLAHLARKRRYKVQVVPLGPRLSRPALHPRSARRYGRASQEPFDALTATSG
ncbi:hypothetical protein ACFQVD_09445 [Streptosporangium amethystogenes subsp. fukuiense]|uniref:Uncharacterized protein n=1 Tax=Streptosporangium amethystogenes subsp. fukuiense TaxID=698418 RepID=A0ABW2SW34_9ACTN